MNNFIYKIVEYIKELELDYKVNIGIFDEEESLVIVPVEGSQIIHEYMNGCADIRLPFEIKIKSRNQEEAFTRLSKVMNHLRGIGDFVEAGEDKDHTLLNIVIDQIPTFVGKQDDGYFYYQTKVTVDLSIN
jgi:hypothetical protein